VLQAKSSSAKRNYDELRRFRVHALAYPYAAVRIR
jgi:hypothetical protein